MKDRWLHHTSFLWDFQSRNMEYLQVGGRLVYPIQPNPFTVPSVRPARSLFFKKAHVHFLGVPTDQPNHPYLKPLKIKHLVGVSQHRCRSAAPTTGGTGRTGRS